MSAFMPKYDPMDFPVEVPANMTLGHRSEAAGSSASVLLSSGYNHGPVTVRVTTIVAPNQFWVHEIPTSPSEYENSYLKLVLEVERRLAARYSSNDSRGIIAAEDLTDNLMVAVRTSESDPHWYRGRIISLLRRSDANGRIVPYVGVFLVDYGRFVQSIPASNLRELPTEMQNRPKHLAFSVKLAGLRPQEMDLKYDTGMKKVTLVVADKWSPAALNYIKEILNHSPAGVAELKKFHVGADGVRFGQLIVRGATSKHNLATLLERKHYAVYDQMTVMADLSVDTMNQSSISAVPATSDRSLSICVPPKESDRIHSFDFAEPNREDGDECDTTRDAVLPDETISSIVDVSSSMVQLSEPWVPPPQRCGRWITLRREPLPPESLRMRMLRAKQNKEDPADVMSNSSVSTEETTGWTQVSDKIDSCTVESEAKLANPMMVPAGVDTGMLLERQG